jgi:hypothetical protein
MGGMNAVRSPITPLSLPLLLYSVVVLDAISLRRHSVRSEESRRAFVLALAVALAVAFASAFAFAFASTCCLLPLPLGLSVGLQPYEKLPLSNWGFSPGPSPQTAPSQTPTPGPTTPPSSE